ncbi:MAG TPA: hypothetical protein VNT24_04255 [Propionibacteriaceae bacterium]|nr:hypothetical protein [Propionibacteriaceae bacterium]
MRTTVDLDEDVLLTIKQRARGEHRSPGAVLSELARRALTESAPVSRDSFFGFQPLLNRGGVVTNELIDRLL